MGKGSAPAPAIELDSRYYEILEKVQNRSNCGKRQYERINIILLASQGVANKQIARILNISLNTVKKWRSRWQSAYPKLQIYAEGVEGKGVKDVALRKKMLEVLKDQARSGAPPRINQAQKEQIISLACESPKDYGVFKTDWTLGDLCQVVLSKQIVSTITSVYIGKLLKNKEASTT